MSEIWNSRSFVFPHFVGIKSLLKKTCKSCGYFTCWRCWRWTCIIMNVWSYTSYHTLFCRISALWIACLDWLIGHSTVATVQLCAQLPQAYWPINFKVVYCCYSISSVTVIVFHNKINYIYKFAVIIKPLEWYALWFNPGGGVLPYIRYIGMCRPKGYGF